MRHFEIRHSTFDIRYSKAARSSFLPAMYYLAFKIFRLAKPSPSAIAAKDRRHSPRVEFPFIVRAQLVVAGDIQAQVKSALCERSIGFLSAEQVRAPVRA
jgi:hypothetical protein